MHRIDREPEAVGRYRAAGGALEFTFFAEAGAGETEARAAIGEVLRGEPDGFDEARLAALPFRTLSRATFLGDRVEPGTGALRRRGEWTTQTGERLTDPTLLRLEGERIRHGGGPIPDLWEGGQFAYAFSEPPYGLMASPAEVAALFDAVRDLILPPGLDHHILDWGSPALLDVSGIFRDGAEWWGVFLFTIYIRATRRLTVIIGSTTD